MLDNEFKEEVLNRLRSVEGKVDKLSGKVAAISALIAAVVYAIIGALL